MVMFKAKFRPTAAGGDKPWANDKPSGDKPRAAQQQQQPQPVPPHPRQDEPEAPPIEKERGPQYPIKEPGPANPPERVRELA